MATTCGELLLALQPLIGRVLEASSHLAVAVRAALGAVVVVAGGGHEGMKVPLRRMFASAAK
jgi:hypothetical protein